MAGLFDSLFGGDQRRQQTAIADLLLMAAMSDGDVSQADLDRIARAIEIHDDLSGLNWDLIKERLPVVRDDGPLFSETRARLVKDLKKRPELQRLGLTLAAQLLGEPLEDEERALLFSIAANFGIAESEAEDLVVPWRDVDPTRTGYRRCRFNDPKAQVVSMFRAIADAQDDELSLLMFKLSATRALLNRLPDAEVVSVGDIVELKKDAYRIDALLQDEQHSYLTRILTDGEAMYPREHALHQRILDRMDSSAILLVAHQGSLAPPDEAALEMLDPKRVRVESLDIS